MAKKNTPELWDSLWSTISIEEDRFNLKREESSIRWKRIEKYILKRFGSFKNLEVIEIGSGGGTNALLFALRGSNVSVLDYSEKALERAKVFFERNGVKTKLILQDALNLKKSLISKFDVSMSFGLAEHFKDKKRTQMIKSHFDLLKDKGVTLISVPNKWNLPYRIQKAIFEAIGFWKVGEEYPFSRSELKKISESLNKNSNFLGDSLITSTNFVNPLRLLRKMNKRNKFDLKKIKEERGTFLDEYLSYALVLIGTKRKK